MKDTARILSQFIVLLKYEDLSREVVETTKEYILDYYAACFAGIKINKKFNQALEGIFFEMEGKKDASVLLCEEKLPVMNAAFLNATYAHGADMDDGNRKAMGHVAAHVMSAVFALAETLGVSGKDIIVAINVGYEVYNRTAAAAQPGLVKRGFHSTGTAGAIACGAAAAKLLGLDEEGVYNAISLSAIQSSGLMIITESGQACKPINPANAARIGILSALMAQKGIESSRYPLDSAKGWLHAMSDTVDETEITEGLGEEFTICQSYLKPHPSCRHTHCGIEAAIKIRERLLKDFGKINVNDIEKIVVNIYPNALRVAGKIEKPETDEDSKFSIHYSLAVSFCRGHFNLSDLKVDKIEQDIYDVIDKIVIVSDETMEDKKAGIRGAKVCFYTADGSCYEEYVPIPKGDAANPFTKDELQSKFFECSGGVITAEQQHSLIAAVEEFEKIEKYGTINIFLN